jgi:hypothetical protein
MTTDRCQRIGQTDLCWPPGSMSLYTICRIVVGRPTPFRLRTRPGPRSGRRQTQAQTLMTVMTSPSIQVWSLHG